MPAAHLLLLLLLRVRSYCCCAFAAAAAAGVCLILATDEEVEAADSDIRFTCGDVDPTETRHVRKEKQTVGSEGRPSLHVAAAHVTEEENRICEEKEAEKKP